MDFRQNRQLQLTGNVHLELDRAQEAGETGGTGRWWWFSPRRWMASPFSRSFDWTLIDRLPFNP